MRLIDADELLKYIPPEEMCSRFAVENALTVDAVPVIRCKDCKHYGVWYFAKCPVRNVRSPDDFCSWAERKEE